jgi:hypothetical protein
MTSPLDQKIRITGPVVVTANRVTDGAVVYRRPDGEWTTDLGSSAVAKSPDIAGRLLADAKADHIRAVGAYVARVDVTPEGHVRPGNLRELIRFAGPTVDLRATL